MENRTERVGESDTPNLFSSRGQNYSILCFLISTMIVFLLSLSLALAALRCYDYCKSRTVRTQVNIRLKTLCRHSTLFLCAGPDVSLFFPAFLRHRGQDRQDGATELSTGLQTSTSWQTLDTMELWDIFYIYKHNTIQRVVGNIYKGCANLVHSSYLHGRYTTYYLDLVTVKIITIWVCKNDHCDFQLSLCSNFVVKYTLIKS